MNQFSNPTDTMYIPKIIHQVWSGIDKPLPKLSHVLGNTWKRDYPEWDYILWDNDKMNSFVQEYYPQYWEAYNLFPYNIQRWDAIRYLFLYRFGGMYVDFDYESIRSIEPLIKGKTCCFSEEPETHKGGFGREVDRYFNNGMMLCVPNHPFMGKIIEAVFSDKGDLHDMHRFDYVLRTTGPWKLMNLYYDSKESERKDIYLIPKQYVTPFDYNQSRRFILEKERSEELENCLKDAYAIHYFFSNWRKEIK